MNDEFEESNVQIDFVNKFIIDARKRGDEVMLMDNIESYEEYDTRGYNFTKVTGAKLVSDGKEIPLEKVTTWASLLRSVCDATKELRQDEFAMDSFNGTINEIVEKYNLVMNHNFSMELFEDDSWINSSVYMNNQNHALEVFNGKKICAVYSGEVVVVLNALIACCDGHTRLLISYNRKRTKLEVPTNSIINTYIESNLDRKVVTKKEVLESIKNTMEIINQYLLNGGDF